MTPRALLTSIGVTAVAFAVAIGVAAGSGNDVDTVPSSRIAVAAFAGDDGVSAYPWAAVPFPEGERLVAKNDPCAILV